MLRSRLLGAALLLSLPLAASASSFIVTTDSIVRGLKASSDTTTDLSSSLRDKKIVREAREDAGSFVASQGDIRGVRLESALAYIRAEQPQLRVSDAELAQAIMAI